MKKILALMFLSLTFFTVGLVCTTEPVSAAPKNGICQATDGNYYYYKNGEIQYDMTSIEKGSVGGKNSWWYIKNGKVTFEDTVEQNQHGWWYAEKGEVKFDYNGIAENKHGKWYLENSKVTFEYEGFGEDKSGNWWYCKKSKAQEDLTTIKSGEVNGQNGWWYVKNGKVSFESIIAPNEYGLWYVKNGRVYFDYKGFAEDEDGNWWYFVESKAQKDKTSIEQGKVNGKTSWWYFENGKVEFKNAIAGNEHGWWYAQNGEVTFNYTGFATNSLGTWYVQNSKIPFTYKGILKDTSGTYWFVEENKVQKGKTTIASGVVKGQDGWWYVEDGKVTIKDTIASNEYGLWYVKNGRVSFDYKGFAEDEDGNWWYFVESKAQKDKTSIEQGKVNGKTSWWYFENGKVEFKNAIAGNEHGWWYAENGEVTFNYTGFATNDLGTWYVQNSKIPFTYKGIIKDTSGTYWYIEENKVQKDKTTVASGRVNGVEAWWYIKNGKVTFEDAVASNENGLWYCEKGKVSFAYEGFGKDSSGTWWYFINSKVHTDYTSVEVGIVNGCNEWWYIKNGKVTYEDAVVTNGYGTWYVQNGIVTFEYSGFCKDSNGDWWYCQRSKIQTDYSGVVYGTVDGEAGNWLVSNGKVDKGDYPYLSMGCAKTVYVGLLQRSLAQLGYVDYVSNGYDDYNYGYGTTYGVQAFQRDHGLADTGNVDTATWRALMSALNTSNKDEYYDADFEAYLDAQGFPESYRNTLRILHHDHPNWVFTAEHISKTFETELEHQYYHTSSTTVSLINGSFPNSFKCTDSIAYDASAGTWRTGWDTGDWVIPNKKAIAYYLDPRNFLDECNIFQFLTMDGSITYTESQISEIAYSLGVSYLGQNYHHTTDDTWINYPEVIKMVCEDYNYSPVALLSSIKQELGTTSTAIYRNQIRGNYSGYESLYNYINYKGYANGGRSADVNALIAAREKGWDTREDAIEGAAKFFAENYVQAGQETTYYKKFNAKSTLPYANHQFMGSISSAYSEGRNAGLALVDALSDETVEFKIPVYKNMPSLICQMP